LFIRNATTPAAASTTIATTSPTFILRDMSVPR
jgi:hypothetical protein